MTQVRPDSNIFRVLVLAPTRRDAEVTAALLNRAGFEVQVCDGIFSLVEHVKLGAGAILMTEEGLAGEHSDELTASFNEQRPWSKIPIVILMREAHASSSRSRIVESIESITLLERPAAMRTVISAVRAAIRERKRQYQIQDQIHEIERLLVSEKDARTQAERANRTKDEFLATVSHELRTPLSAILLWTRMLQTGALKDGDLAEAIGAIARSAEAQRQLIGDLLDMARMMSGKLRLQVTSAELQAVVSASVEAIRPTAELKGVTLEVLLNDVGRIYCDPDRIQQIVWNLLSNSLKFTSAGGRTCVELFRTGQSLVIRVRDTGQGIDPQFLPFVFERFRQADGSMTRAHGGLGLGLAIVRELVELHGGKIRAESEGAGCGATFTVEIPWPGAPDTLPSTQGLGIQAAAMTSDKHPLDGLNVLLVEDEPETRRALSSVLESAGAHVRVAGSVDAAMELYRSQPPDVLVSDIGLPGEDGYALMHRIRKLAAERREPISPALALTAYARTEDREEAIAAGFHAYASKPVEPDQLLRAIAALCGRAEPAPAT